MATVANGNCNIWFESVGDGPPVVMVYGIGNNSRRWWTEFPRLLASRYRLTMMDNRGVGYSDRPHEAWTMADMVADVHAVVEAASLDTFHLLGCSLGSSVVRHYALAHGERLRSLNLLCPPNGTPATEADMKLGIMWDPAKPRVDSERASWAVVHPEAWAAAHQAELLADFERSEAERTPGRTFHHQMQSVAGAGDPNPGLNAFAWPVLILHGTADRLVPPKNAETLEAAVPRARLEWLDGASHTFWQHDPAGAAGAVLNFLDAAEAASGGK